MWTVYIGIVHVYIMEYDKSSSVDYNNLDNEDAFLLILASVVQRFKPTMDHGIISPSAMTRKKVAKSYPAVDGEYGVGAWDDRREVIIVHGRVRLGETAVNNKAWNIVRVASMELSVPAVSPLLHTNKYLNTIGFRRRRLITEDLIAKYRPGLTSKAWTSLTVRHLWYTHHPSHEVCLHKPIEIVLCVDQYGGRQAFFGKPDEMRLVVVPQLL